MKTDDFKITLMQLCDKLNRGRTNEIFGLKFVETEDELAISTNVLDQKIVSVSKKEGNDFSYMVSGSMRLNSEEIFSFTKKLMDYVTTPVAEREDERRLRIHFGESFFSDYLERNRSTGEYNVLTKDDSMVGQVWFNRKEIAEYLRTNDEKIIDWFITRFGQEMTE